MPSCVGAIPSSIAGAQHAVRDHAADLARRERGSAGRARARRVRRSGTRSPGAMLRTPTTTSRSPAPVLTRARQSLSEFGWSRTSRTLATTTPSRPSHGRSIRSTSAPLAVSSSARSSADRSTGRIPAATSGRSSCHALELLEEPHVAVEEQPDVGDRRSGAWRRVRSPVRTRTPCTARCRTRSSQAPWGAPCPRRGARSIRCRTCGSRRRRR